MDVMNIMVHILYITIFHFPVLVCLILERDGALVILGQRVTVRNAFNADPTTIFLSFIGDPECTCNMADAPHCVEVASPWVRVVPEVAPDGELLWKHGPLALRVLKYSTRWDTDEEGRRTRSEPIPSVYCEGGLPQHSMPTFC